MTRTHLYIVAAGIFIHAVGYTVSASTASFLGLGTLPGAHHSNATGVSYDGSTVVGSSNGEAFRWTAGSGLVGLGALPSEYRIWGSTAMATSADGSIVVGVSDSGTGDSRQAFRWTAAEGMVGLGDTPSGFNFYSSANGISPDGSIIVGSIGIGEGGGEAYRWTAGEGMVGLGILGSGNSGSTAYATSEDGTVIVGVTEFSSFRWTANTGMVGLFPQPGSGLGSYLGGAFDTSADGSVIVGSTINWNADVPAPYRWTAETGMVQLGSSIGNASATSADGLVVVGINSSEGVFIWDPVNGIRSLYDILTDVYSLDLTGWQLNRATGIAADGLTIVGDGINPSGKNEAWIATITTDVIPEPGSLAMLCLGIPALLKRQSLLRRSRTSF